MPSKPDISTSKKTISFWDLSEKKAVPIIKGYNIENIYFLFFEIYFDYLG